jgi:acylphosphatase
MKISYLIKIKGIVTGICFRYYTLQEVKKYSGLQGYVRNVYEGNVEVLIQGEKEKVLCLIEWLKHGPSHARVDEIKINQIPIRQTLDSFTIRY